ncbi:deacetylase [Paenibacillus darwinianus]|uniref:Deacetylase n=1 Tax=Paenibacillus darwinianus TaxID=1380763 RepID=A0A9W5S2W0_9BACL|nr:bacillithiol biosynthesis deacetylase BshB1 [Paenibacillus darwinianus]EXX91248.1 deacetylase [Paenibacillus darwinianus]EXX92083.1 deacetylase [Paenibacillus darwinianus]EXX92613.1 deacetylase [Paenibacillus darwinianus]
MNGLDMLCLGAHPDDVEIGMGGTIAKHAAAGLRIGICDLTRAEMSSNGTPECREAEAAEASAVLGLAYRSCLALPDRGLTGSAEQLEAVVREIRACRPRVVFAPYWDDRHPDHNSCSRIVEEAVFNAKLRRYLPDAPPVQVEQLVFYYINDVKDVGLMVDVSGCYERKRNALATYRSQFEPVAEGSGRVATPLNQRYIENVEARDRLLGASRQWTYAEGFIVKRPFAVEQF